MKILHVIPSLGASLGGPSQVAMNLVKALCDLGVEAEIATTNYDRPQVLDVPLGQRVEYGIEGGSVPVWFLPYNPPAAKEFIFSQAFTKWCWQHLREYDVIDNHYLFSYAPTCAATIARQQGIPYTVRTMGQLTPWALAQNRVKKQIYTTLIERHNLQKAAAIHCTTLAEAEDVHNFGINTPTITLPLGVNAPANYPHAGEVLRQQFNVTTDTPIILFLSRLHYKKRPDLLLRSLVYLKIQGFRFHAILAGTGEVEYLAQLKDLTISLGIIEYVSFPGLVTGRDKDLLLQGSDLFVLPSFSENFGIAVAEALMAGLPVVITPGIQIAPEIADANAGFIVQGEVEPIADAIAQLLTSAQLRAKLGSNGQKLARSRYSWSTIAQNLASTYKTIANKERLLKDTSFDNLAIYKNDS